MQRGRCQVAAAAIAMFLVIATVSSAADVQVNVNIGPPPVVVAEPPEVVLVPGSRVYFVPEYDFDIFFYDGYWWSPRGDRWYRARYYDGPWRVISRRSVPRSVYSVPRDYRHVYVREHRIPYGQWKKQGRDHDRGRHGGKGDHGGRGKHHDKDDHRGRGGHQGPGEHR